MTQKTLEDNVIREEIICDRCKKKVKGFRDILFTAGFYDVTSKFWIKYANPGEKNVCDSCMWADPRYKEDFPHIRV